MLVVVNQKMKKHQQRTCKVMKKHRNLSLGVKWIELWVEQLVWISQEKKIRHSSNGSATSKAAAGRKNRMLANRAAAFINSPQSVYLKGRQNVFTKWLCLGCGYVPLCNPKWMRKVHHNCFQKYHAVKKISVTQGQHELAKKLEEFDWLLFCFIESKLYMIHQGQIYSSNWK